MWPWWVFALCSAVFSTIFTIMRKKWTKKEHALEFEVTRSTFMVLFSLFLIPFFSFKYTWQSILIIYFVSVVCAIGILLNAKSIRHMQISEVAPLFNLTPGFLAIMAFLFLGETLTKYQISGIILLIAGSYVLETDHNSFFKSALNHLKSKYVTYAITAAIIFGIGSLLEKLILNNYMNPYEYMFFIWFFIALNFIILSSIEFDGIKGIKHCIKITKFNVILTALFSFIANIFTLIAMSMAYVSLVIPIRRLSTLGSTLIGGEMFHEKGLVRKSVACLIMLVGACLIILL
jgi:drug/metabolite transporter (DMT)-like permease